MSKKVLMLGLDALVPPMLEKFMAEGIMPNVQRLCEGGCFSRLLSCIPAQTPTNWHTVATGATPGSHSVVTWGAHRPDDPMPEFHRPEAFNSGLCLAEYIWEAAARHDKKSVVMNYGGFPPTTDHAVHVDRLFAPTRSYYDVALPTVYHTLERDGGHPIEFEAAAGSPDLPTSNRPPLAAAIPVVPSSEGEAPTYSALLVAEGDGYDTLLLGEGDGAAEPVARLQVGQWSDWVRAGFDTEEMGEVEAAFRFKLVECSPDGRRFRLYRSAAFPTDGRFVSDPDLGRKLVEKLGPYVQAVMSVDLHMHAELLDWQTMDEALAEEAAWWAGAADMAMAETDAELFYMHWHLPDHVGHVFVAWVDPTGTDYTPERAEKGWEILRNYYRATDRFVGEFLKRFDLEQNVVAIVSEHGMPANKKAASLENAFKDSGWITITPDGRDVDWARSKIFISQNHLWINLEGREPTGIVPPEDYLALRAELQGAMRDIKDPETGEHVLAFVLTREEAPMVGLYGQHIGDLVFCYAGGYRWTGANVLQMGEERVVFPSGGGNHGPMVCTYETDVSSVYGTLILAGDGVRKGVCEERSEAGARKTPDVAPTLAYLLGIEPPAQNEGRVLHEFLEGFNSQRPERTLTPAYRTLLRRSRPRRKPQLKGDVTDEGA